MLESLSIALQITLIGMGLVFGAIILLWGVIALLVRLTTEKQPAQAPKPVSMHPLQQGDTRMIKRRAAAAAVAMAFQEYSARKTPVFASHSGNAISPWQAALRGREMEPRGRTR